MNRTSRHVLKAAVLAAIAGCGSNGIGSLITGTPGPVGSIAITGPTEMTGPGVVRASVNITNATNELLNDSIPTIVTTTGPFHRIHGTR
jgi:hypothetical protein